ncbi:MAG TPA: ATP-dependent Clp protease proteolytic subunit [bacterium]
MAKKKSTTDNAAPEVETPSGEQPTNPRGSDSQSPPKAPFYELFALSPENATQQVIKDVASRQIVSILEESPISAGYNVLFLYDENSITRGDSNRIYESLSKADAEKPILLIISSPGGEIPAAYFIAKLCRDATKHELHVSVPRQAKSAATLICCGADKIHMGSLSELGPIDPQIRRMPALAVKHSVEHLAQLAAQYPGARDMLSDYLTKSLPIETLGYYERAAESAVQYAERLLSARIAVRSSKEANAEIAKRLVYFYKDHGFAIDAAEATTIFGATVIQRNTGEYLLSNRLYSSLDLMSWILRDRFKKVLSVAGNCSDGIWTYSAQTG